MADYHGMKNNELIAICKERGLPHSGKKTELAKRLEDFDAANASGGAKPVAAEDEIDFDDDPPTEVAKAATTEAAANAIAAGGVGEVGNPQAVPNQQPAIDPTQTDDLTVAAEPVAEPASEDVSFSTGLANRTLEEEIEKRKARARKFGMPEDTDEIKALERAKRFGTTDLPGLLNKALPQKQEKKRGRNDAEPDGGIRKRSRGRPGPGKRQGDAEKPQTKEGGYPSWMTEKDREAAEKRKSKFAGA